MCIYMCAERENEEVVYICIHTHTLIQTYMHICIHTYIYVYQYIFTHLNPVLFSHTLFSAIRSREAVVSRGSGGLPCPLQPLHHPK